LLPGPTLEQRLKDLAAQGERMPQSELLATITQLASALDAAHAIGVIHRDVKPSNALYNAQGQFVLTDFGIARSAADASRTATAAGVVMGTPGYVAPEQAISSASLTPACDIYALGVVLFELLAGRLPFEADTAMGVVLKHLYDPPPPPTSVRPDLPPAIDTVVLRALEKEPAARFSSAGELAQALAAAWPLAAPPAATPTPADIHSQATSIWAGAPGAASRQARPPTSSPSVPPQVAQPITPSITGTPARGRRWLLPLLGLLLLGLLITAGVLAARGSREEPSGTAATSPLVSATVAAASVATATTSAGPTAPSTTPSIAPLIQATIAPPTSLPTAAAASAEAPTASTAAVEPIGDLRALLTNGIAAGQAGDDGQDLLKKLDEVQQAITGGDAKKAVKQLRDLQKKVQEKVREGKMDAGLGDQVLSGISRVASAYGLDVPSSGTP
jgi:eukaryotic-like serine/threonine-protein kinase